MAALNEQRGGRASATTHTIVSHRQKNAFGRSLDLRGKVLFFQSWEL